MSAGRVDDVFTKISQHLSLDGTASGTRNANVDGSVTPQLFKISPEDGTNKHITRMITMIRDTGTFRAETYGAEPELAIGTEVGIYDDTTGALVQSFVPNHSLTNNVGWGEFCFDVNLRDWGAGDKFILARWTFERSGVEILLNKWNNHCLGVKIQDNLVGLVEHLFVVQGWSKP